MMMLRMVRLLHIHRGDASSGRGNLMTRPRPSSEVEQDGQDEIVLVGCADHVG
jgi:hypothetical protein